MTIIGQYYSNLLPVAGGATNSFIPISATAFYYGLREISPTYCPIVIHSMDYTQCSTIPLLQSNNHIHTMLLSTSSPSSSNYVEWNRTLPLGISISFNSHSSKQGIMDQYQPIISNQLYRIQSIQPGSIADTMGINASTPLHQYVAYRGEDGYILRQPLSALIEKRTTYMLGELSQSSTPSGSPKNGARDNPKSILKMKPAAATTEL